MAMYITPFTFIYTPQELAWPYTHYHTFNSDIASVIYPWIKRLFSFRRSRLSHWPPLLTKASTATFATGKDRANCFQGFKIFDYGHRDFQCGALTRQGTPCKNKVTCSFHTLAEKSSIERSDTVSNLARNFKYLQELHQSVYQCSKSLRKRVLAEDSDDEQTHARTISRGKLPIKRHNSYQAALNDSYVIDFVTELQSKLEDVKDDADQRLSEFEYKVTCKNSAVFEYYQIHPFEP